MPNTPQLDLLVSLTEEKAPAVETIEKITPSPTYLPSSLVQLTSNYRINGPATDHFIRTTSTLQHRGRDVSFIEYRPTTTHLHRTEDSTTHGSRVMDSFDLERPRDISLTPSAG